MGVKEDRGKKMREMVEKLTQWGLPYLCAWVQGQCPGLATGRTNTVAGEFIWADGFVGDVIRLNWKLLQG